jgi:hypothetical protein
MRNSKDFGEENFCEKTLQRKLKGLEKRRVHKYALLRDFIVQSIEKIVKVREIRSKILFFSRSLRSPAWI